MSFSRGIIRVTVMERGPPGILHRSSRSSAICLLLLLLAGCGAAPERPTSEGAQAALAVTAAQAVAEAEDRNPAGGTTAEGGEDPPQPVSTDKVPETPAPPGAVPMAAPPGAGPGVPPPAPAANAPAEPVAAPASVPDTVGPTAAAEDSQADAGGVPAAASGPAVPESPAPAAGPSPTTGPADPGAESREPAAAPPAEVMDLDGLEARLRKTKAIGLFTKLELKSQVEGLLDEVEGFHQARNSMSLSQLKEHFNLLVMKLLVLLEDDDPQLHRDIARARPALWTTLADPVRFSSLRGS
jgi:hypothetical protein